jgi:hypothetical protein
MIYIHNFPDAGTMSYDELKDPTAEPPEPETAVRRDQPLALLTAQMIQDQSRAHTSAIYEFISSRFDGGTTIVSHWGIELTQEIFNLMEDLLDELGFLTRDRLKWIYFVDKMNLAQALLLTGRNPYNYLAFDRPTTTLLEDYAVFIRVSGLDEAKAEFRRNVSQTVPQFGDEMFSNSIEDIWRIPRPEYMGARDRLVVTRREAPDRKMTKFDPKCLTLERPFSRWYKLSDGKLTYLSYTTQRQWHRGHNTSNTFAESLSQKDSWRFYGNGGASWIQTLKEGFNLLPKEKPDALYPRMPLQQIMDLKDGVLLSPKIVVNRLPKREEKQGKRYEMGIWYRKTRIGVLQGKDVLLDRDLYVPEILEVLPQANVSIVS